MAPRLIDLIDPKTLNITLSDIAQGIGKSADKLYFPEPKREGDDWRWANICLIVVKGEGGRFVSYRVLQCWLEAIAALLNRCQDWQALEELIAIAQSDLEGYSYPEAHERQLRQILQQQRFRLENLKIQARANDRVWEWARGWTAVLEACPTEASLNIALQLYKSQRTQFLSHAEAIEWVLQVGRDRRSHLRNTK